MSAPMPTIEEDLTDADLLSNEGGSMSGMMGQGPGTKRSGREAGIPSPGKVQSKNFPRTAVQGYTFLVKGSSPVNGHHEREGDSPGQRRAFSPCARHTRDAQLHAASTHSCCTCSCTRSSTRTSSRNAAVSSNLQSAVPPAAHTAACTAQQARTQLSATPAPDPHCNSPSRPTH